MPKHVSSKLLLPACLLVSSSTTAFAEESKDATATKAKLDLRYRIEAVDQSSKPEDAFASTLRSRLTLSRKLADQWTVVGEIDNVASVGSEKFNSRSNGQIQYPVVADPTGTDVNQLLVRYSGQDITVTGGRQRVIHADQRFVGGVAWRQNEQTYDGARMVYTGLNNVTIDYTYASKVNRIFGPDDGPVQPAALSGDNHLIHTQFSLAPQQSLSAYAYLLDIDLEGDYAAGKSIGNSTDTMGLEYKGQFGAANLRLGYAQQSDAGDSSLDYDADYYLVEAKYSFDSFKVHAGLEVLGSDNGVGFKTPLATLHKFQGWADKFLVTPGGGISDTYVGVAGKVGKSALLLVHHDFESDQGGMSYGSELNASVTLPVGKKWKVQVKYADFSSDSPTLSDDKRYWVTVNWKS